MTNNQHGQVPEALIDLIDAYAETRHRYGRIYNARTEAARNAVIEALSGVQALSAAPAGFVPVAAFDRLHAHAESLAARLLAASPTPTAEQPIGEVVVTKDEDGQIVAVTRQDDEGRILSVIATSGPAEQQAASSAVLKAIREANMQLVRTGDDAFMLVPYKVATAEQAAPKAAPTLPEGWTDCTIEFGNDGPEVVAYGPKRMMNRLAKWLGKYFAQVIADAATKAAPGEPSDADIDAFLDSPGGIEWVIADKRERYRLLVRAVLAKWAAPQQEAQEPVAWLNPWRADQVTTDYDAYGERGIPLYAAPQPAPAPLSDDAKDAARYRWLIDQHWIQTEVDWRLISTHQDSTIRQLDAAIDAAIAAQGGKDA